MASQEGEWSQSNYLKMYKIKIYIKVGRNLGCLCVIGFLGLFCSTLSYSYAEVVVTSEESLKILLEKIPQCKLHGEMIDCRFATRQNLSVFEETANKRESTAIFRIALHHMTKF